ncbi:MAG: hypothetical protein ACOX3K_05155 [Bacilli bacterium]|jgi:hypothetical protein
MAICVQLIGYLGAKTNSLTREVTVPRFHETGLREQHLDTFRLVSWNYRPSALLYQAKEKSQVAISGRLENDETGRPIIIVEQVAVLHESD